MTEMETCHDRNHAGLREYAQGLRLAPDAPAERVGIFDGPKEWMGQDVALVAHMVQAHAQSARDQRWRPMETAPKDGTGVLLAGQGWMTVGCYWPGRSCWTADSHTGPQITQPIIGWMPLPEPPR